MYLFICIIFPDLLHRKLAPPAFLAQDLRPAPGLPPPRFLRGVAMVSTAQAQVLASATACCIFAAIAMILRKRGGYVVATWRQDWDDLSGGYNGALFICYLFIYIYVVFTHIIVRYYLENQ